MVRSIDTLKMPSRLPRVASGARSRLPLAPPSRPAVPPSHVPGPKCLELQLARTYLEPTLLTCHARRPPTHTHQPAESGWTRQQGTAAMLLAKQARASKQSRFNVLTLSLSLLVHGIALWCAIMPLSVWPLSCARMVC